MLFPSQCSAKLEKLSLLYPNRTMAHIFCMCHAINIYHCLVLGTLSFLKMDISYYLNLQFCWLGKIQIPFKMVLTQHRCCMVYVCNQCFITLVGAVYWCDKKMPAEATQEQESFWSTSLDV